MQTKELSITKKNFWDRNAARYDRFMRKNAIAYDQLYALLRPAVWHKTVLEVATGTGQVAKHLLCSAYRKCRNHNIASSVKSPLAYSG